MTTPKTLDNRYGSWLDAALQKVPHTRAAILGTTDGLLRAHSTGIDQDSAELLAAALSGTVSLTKAQTEVLGEAATGWVQCILEYSDCFVVVKAAGANVYLAATAAKNADMGVLSYTLDDLVHRLGDELDSPVRTSPIAAI
ncbi:MAG TPA: roadblock/LC7 domain-containing protein, partial [Umezawaea sp.]|nr:roadblock/LC7 domain-containing protein [Umezawaea sp.]